MKTRIVVLLSLTCFLIAPAMAQNAFGQDSKTLANIMLYKTDIITVGAFKGNLERLNKQIKAAETLEGMGLIQDSSKMKQNPEALLDSEIEKVLVRQAAEKEKVAVTENEINAVVSMQKKQLGTSVSDEAFNEYVEQQLGVKMPEFRKMIEDSLLQTKLLAKLHPELKDKTYPVSDDEILDVYDQKAAEFVIPRTIRYQYLIMSTTKMTGDEKKAARQKMLDFQKLIKSGGKTAFDKLMEKAAEDTTYEGGDIGTYVTKNDARLKRFFGPGFAEALFKLNTGEFSDVLETNIGYVIACITYKKGVTLPGLDEAVRPGESTKVRDAIRDAISQQKSTIEIRKASAEMLKKLKEQATIKKFENNYPWK